MIDLLSVAWLGKPIWMWLGFHALVATLLAFDLGLLHRDKEHEIGVKESLLLTAFYFSLGLAFGGWIWWYLGASPPRNTSPVSWSRSRCPWTTSSSSR